MYYNRVYRYNVLKLKLKQTTQLQTKELDFEVQAKTEQASGKKQDK